MFSSQNVFVVSYLCCNNSNNSDIINSTCCTIADYYLLGHVLYPTTMFYLLCNNFTSYLHFNL